MICVAAPAMSHQAEPNIPREPCTSRASHRLGVYGPMATLTVEVYWRKWVYGGRCIEETANVLLALALLDERGIEGMPVDPSCAERTRSCAAQGPGGRGFSSGFSEGFSCRPRAE